MLEVDLVPSSAGSVDANAIVKRLAQAQRQLTVFDDRVVAFMNDLSKRLRRHPHVAASPALGALAFWIRPSTVKRLAAEWSTLCDLTPNGVRVPRGVVFHMPPTNVDTLFVYSWLMSALMGNGNVIRLSPGALDGAAALIETISETLDEHPAVANTTALVSYGHEAAVTTALSTADIRVIWGGDDTVRSIRGLASAPYTRDLAFPDRYSLAVLDATAVVSLNDGDLDELAHRFFNDAYWFDQLGCASPRLIVWRGDGTTSDEAGRRFRAALARQLVTRGHPETPASAALAKLVHAADAAANGTVDSIDWVNNSLTSVQLSRLDGLQRDAPGGGLFYEAVVAHLDELRSFVIRKDQTVTTFGIDHQDLRRFVTAVGAQGIDRVVPVGEALTFGRFWDGVDLLVEFTRFVQVSASAPPG